MDERTPVNFDQLLAEVTELLHREGRLSYRGLKRRFEIDDAFVDDLKAELVDARRLALDEDGKVLVWGGGPAAAPEPAPQAAERPPAPARAGTERKPLQPYTPPHLVRAVLKTRSAIEGERKQVSVLHCDVAGSTELSQRLDAEAMHEVMDRVLRVAAEVVHRYGGTVNQYLGDGLMALFGAPLALEDHAVRSVHAALATHEAIEKENIGLRREHGIEIKLRIGVNTGSVVVGRIGDDLRMDYTASGNTTHVAERLQGLAQPGTTLIAEGTRRLVEGYAVVEALGPMAVKGQQEPVAVYRLVKRLPRRLRFEVLAERGLTPLVGRGPELALLAERFALACAGRGQAVGIVGEAGVGKSRIVNEFVRSLASADVVYAVGQCTGQSQFTPYVPIIEVLRTLFHIDEGDDAGEIRDKVRRGLDELGPTLGAAAPLVNELLVPGAADEAALGGLDPSARRKLMLEALLAITAATTQQRPMVVVIEDLHWIDQSSEHCLNGLVQSLGRLPVLLITTQRTGHAVPWATSSSYTQVPVDVFTASEADRMVSAILSGREIAPDLRRIVQDKAGGNPLFVEEVVRSLTERGAVGAGAGTRDGEAAQGDFPSTVQDILRARIDELATLIKRSVQAAAAIGQVFGVRLLAQLPDVGEDLEETLDVATRMGLIQEHRFFPEIEYAFKHAIVQEVAYQSLLAPRRRELHGQIGRAMEHAWHDRIDEYLPVIAYHFSRSDDTEKAFTYSMRAGDRAERLYARAEATTHYLAALATARSFADPKRSQESQVDAIVKLAAAAHTREHMDRDAHNLEQGQAMAEALADGRRLAQVLYWRGRLHYARSNFGDALECAQRSIALADELGDESLAAPAVNLVARVRWQQGDYGKAAQLLARSTEQMRRLGNAAEEATAAGFAGWTLAFLGEVDSSLAYTERGLRLARELENPFAEAAAYFYRGAAFDQRGAWPEALAEYSAARRVAHAAGDLFREYLVMCQEGRALAMAGDLERAFTTLNEAIALAERLGTTFVLAWPKAYLAQCLLENGDVETARTLAAEALRRAQGVGDKYGQFMAHRALAGVLAAQRSPDYRQAEEALRQSIRLQHEMGVKPELGRTYLQYADLSRRNREVAQARAYLNVAVDIFRQQGMSWDLERAERMEAALT
jgi:class 3 adenylate cyclase/tetratricopeptide (TPR) repeat protein